MALLTRLNWGACYRLLVSNKNVGIFTSKALITYTGSTLSDREIEDLLSDGEIPISSLPDYMAKTKGALGVVHFFK